MNDDTIKKISAGFLNTSIAYPLIVTFNQSRLEKHEPFYLKSQFLASKLNTLFCIPVLKERLAEFTTIQFIHYAKKQTG